MDRAEADDGTAWAPATDTYIGPRDRFTHRIGSESQRDALLAQVERETRLRRDLQRWQWVALATACVATLAFSLAIVALMKQRSAEQIAATCVRPASVGVGAEEGSEKSAAKRRQLQEGENRGSEETDAPTLD